MVVTLEAQILHRKIDALARAALQQCDGDLRSARAQVTRQIYADQTLLNALIDELVGAAVENCIGLRHRADNQRILHAQSRPATSSAAQAATAVLLGALVLGNGRRLGMARRPELLAEATFHEKQARSMSRKARFFSLVAEHLPNDRVTVDQTLTEEQLHDLFVQAERTT